MVSNTTIAGDCLRMVAWYDSLCFSYMAWMRLYKVRGATIKSQ